MDASGPRIIALILIIKSFLTGRYRATPKCLVDHLVLLAWVWSLIAVTIADAFLSPLFIFMVGRGLDTTLMYFVARYYITSVDDLKGMANWLILVAAVMGLLGLLESFNVLSPYSAAKAFRPWDVMSISSEIQQYRYGLVRAKGSASVHIYFGTSMLIVTGILWSINKGFPLGRFGRWGILLGILGTISSVSSGPWMGCAVMFSIGLYRYKPHLIRPTIYFILLLFLFLEVASNRHFYHLVSYITLDAGTAWYRARLLEIAVSHLSEYWFFGFGTRFPSHWADLLDGTLDIVNHFLMVAIYGGLLAMFLYIASHYFALKYVIERWKSDDVSGLRLVSFYLGCVLVALEFVSMTVSLYGPPLILIHVLLGLVVAVSRMRRLPVADAPAIVHQPAKGIIPGHVHKYFEAP